VVVNVLRKRKEPKLEEAGTLKFIRYLGWVRGDIEGGESLKRWAWRRRGPVGGSR